MQTKCETERVAFCFGCFSPKEGGGKSCISVCEHRVNSLTSISSDEGVPAESAAAASGHKGKGEPANCILCLVLYERDGGLGGSLCVCVCVLVGFLKNIFMPRGRVGGGDVFVYFHM